MLLTAELLCDERDEELGDDGITGTLDELRLEGAMLEFPPPLMMPKGAGCALQAARDTQLAPFS